MKTCSACSHSQDEGNFCGKCGTPLTETSTQQNPSETVVTHERVLTPPNEPLVENTQPNEQMEKIKNESKVFFSFLLQQLKFPSAHFNDKNSSVKNSVLSVSLYFILTAIAVYSIIRPIAGTNLFDYDFGPSFIQIIFYFTLLSLLVLSINVTAIFVTSKLFSENLSFLEVLRKVGGYFALPIAFSATGILLALINSYSLSTFVLYFGFILGFGIIPTFVMIKLLSTKTKSIDGFYAFLFYLVFTSVTGFIIVLLIADSAIGDLMNFIDF